MNPLESLLKAAQQIDSPDVKVKIVVEVMTPPRRPPSAAATTMPPPPPPPSRVELCHNNTTLDNNLKSVLAIPSLSSPYAAPPPVAPPQYYNYYNYAASATPTSSVSSAFAAPTAAASMMMMSTPPSSSSSTSSWPYYHLNPRYSGHHGHEVMVPTTASASCVGHLPPSLSAPQPLCLFPTTLAQASQGVANHPTAAAAASVAATAPAYYSDTSSYATTTTAAAAAVGASFKPIVMRSPSPEENGVGCSTISRRTTGQEDYRNNGSSSNNIRRVTTDTADPAAPVGFLELKPSANEDVAPPALPTKEDEVEEDALPASAPSKVRSAVTPDAKANNDDDDDDDYDYSDEESITTTTYATTRSVIEDTTSNLPTLFDKYDMPYISPTHYIIGSEILEAFVVPEYDDDDEDRKYDAAAVASTAASSSYSAQKKKAKQVKKKKKKSNFRAGSIAFRCRFCKHCPHKKNKAPLSTIYPESLEGLYRANLRFQANHLNSCEYFPDALKKRLEYAYHRSVHQVGVRSYWVECAERKGFRSVEVEGKKRLGFEAPEYY